MPTYNKSEAKENGWAQTRAAIQKFQGDVLKVEVGQWGARPKADGTGMQDGKEFMDITSINNKVLASTEAPSMDISASYNFRVNMSDFKGSFWIEKFLDQCDKLHILLPDGLQGKNITWEKQTQQSIKNGVHNPEFDSTNYVPIAIGQGQVNPVAPVFPQTAQPTPAITDPMEAILTLAIGKTDAQFKSAIGLDPAFVGSPYLPLAKSGAIMQTLLAQGKVKLVAGADGKPVYVR